MQSLDIGSDSPLATRPHLGTEARTRWQSCEDRYTDIQIVTENMSAYDVVTACSLGHTTVTESECAKLGSEGRMGRDCKSPVCRGGR